MILAHFIYSVGGFIPWGANETIKKAEHKLWYSAMLMKWLKGDGVKWSWLKVKKEREDYRWLRIDQPDQARFIQLRLAEECDRQGLIIDEYHMHVYESAASGIGYPYVWDPSMGLEGYSSNLRSNATEVSARTIFHLLLWPQCKACRRFTRRG